jgi:UDP-N-acetylglucosamine--N-acetylmuramyl-(pentapeptide) pyrophosphoryl-undecaprenol N-acetylglucosamine transferase
MGGSQGALSLNQLFLRVLRRLAAVELQGLSLLVISGGISYDMVKKELEGMSLKHVLFAYTETMPLLYQRADLLIARAGAGTVFEALAYGLPAIYVPYPHASSHQEENAAYLAKKGAAMVVREGPQAEAALTALLREFLNDPQGRKLKQMREKAFALRKVDGCAVFEKRIQEWVFPSRHPVVTDDGNKVKN